MEIKSILRKIVFKVLFLNSALLRERIYVIFSYNCDYLNSRFVTITIASFDSCLNTRFMYIELYIFTTHIPPKQQLELNILTIVRIDVLFEINQELKITINIQDGGFAFLFLTVLKA